MKQVKSFLGTLTFLAVILTFANAQDNKNAKPQDVAEGPQVGQPAPDFELPWADQTAIHAAKNEWMKLSSLRGSNVILAFYPADWSGGCTKEMCSFRDEWNDLGKLNAKILGISGDYVFSHHEWAKFHHMTIPLLQDHDHAVSKTYASFGPQLGGINKRTIFLIDKTGNVRYRNLKFNAGAKEDYEALRSELAKLQEQASK